MRFLSRLTRAAITVAIALCFLPASALATRPPNLIANPSVEEPATEPALPSSWQRGAWGDNKSSFTHRRRGAQDGRRSLFVAISSYTSGDAKWYFEPVSIRPNERYVYSDYYRSNVPTEIYLQVQDALGNLSHQFLGRTPKSKRWTEAVFDFTTPAGAAKATVLHVIREVGYLETDHFILEAFETPEVTGGVPNASLELSHDGTDVPAGWQTGNWGRNSATFTYLKSGHTGNRSVKAEVTSHLDGDAKWYFDPQPVTAGQPYRFSDWYRSNRVTQVAVMTILADGSAQYLGLPPADPARQWTLYSTKFMVPPGTVRVSIFHVVNRVGYLITDDYSLVPAPTVGFARSLVSLTFDDAWKSVREQALPILQRFGAPATHYVLTGEIGEDPEYMNLADLRFLAGAGHQIASHGVSHLDLTTLRRAEVNHEVRDSKKFLDKNGLRPTLDWASPYGASNGETTATVKKVYRSQRSTRPGFNSRDDFDLYTLKVQNVTFSTTSAEVQNWVEQAVREKTWLILVYHEVDTHKREYSTTPAQLEAHLQIIGSAGAKILTVDQALAELLPQL